jgi:molybdate transport system permease protein
MDWVAFRVTLALAFWTTAFLVIVGVPLAYWLAERASPLRSIVNAVVTLPLVLPPTVLGFYLLWASAGSRLPFSFFGILCASILVNLPFAVRPFTASFAAVNPRLREAAWCLGASQWRTFRTITLPLAWPGLLAGIVLTFLHTIGEFGVVLMVGGSKPSVTRTLSIALYDDVQALDYDSAHRTALVLIVFAFTAVLATHSLRRSVL